MEQRNGGGDSGVDCLLCSSEYAFRQVSVGPWALCRERQGHGKTCLGEDYMNKALSVGGPCSGQELWGS